MLDLARHMRVDGTYNGKTLAERLAGRFYTPVQLADDLAEKMLEAFDASGLTSVAATDPFCGDGRLIMSLLSAASDYPRLAKLPWFIELRDREAEAAHAAVERVEATARRLGMTVQAVAVFGDTFVGDLSPRFDLVITNPPWELLKPDARELRHMDANSAERHKAELRTTARRLDERFPDARADSAWGGWGTNLARCGWDLGLRICRKGGVLGIILPATLMGDQSSVTMRRNAFEGARLVDAAAYPAEARLFDRVDQAVVALTMRVGGRIAGKAPVRFFDADRLAAGEQSIAIGRSAMEARGWSIPVGPPAGIDRLESRISSHPTLSSFEGGRSTDLWLGRELDETRITEKIVPGDARPFIKGRMITRHGVVENPSVSVRPDLCTGFHSIRHPRAVWRDVARSSSKRRMIGTVIPAGWVAGNSLHVACFRDGDTERTLALHALLSSLVLEAQVRARLTTGHMSLGVVRRARVPTLDARLVGSLASLARRAMTDEAVVPHLEIAVARAYGLNRDDMMTLFSDFPKLDQLERDTLTDARSWAA